MWWADLVALVKDPRLCFCAVLPWWENQHQQSRIMSTIWWDSIGGRTATQLISIPHHPLVIYLLWQTHPYGTLGGELCIPRLLESVPILILYPKQELAPLLWPRRSVLQGHAQRGSLDFPDFFFPKLPFIEKTNKPLTRSTPFTNCFLELATLTPHGQPRCLWRPSQCSCISVCACS